MQDSPAPTPAGAPPRPVGILLLAVLQGLGLHALHRAIEARAWPATDLAVLIPAYLLLIFLPLTAQPQARYFGERRLWGALAALGVVLLALGAYFGARVAPDGRLDDLDGELLFANGFALCILWLLFVPFLRAWLETGRWRAPYRALFDAAWRNKLTLAEALLFTGVFWLLLGLWAALFRTLDIRFFEELFREPLFVYPVTALAFGIALHLVGRIDRIIDVVLAQLLGLLKWSRRWPGSSSCCSRSRCCRGCRDCCCTGSAALGATWMLWLVAVTVLLLNAAYQAGDREAPYGRGLGAAMRAVPPLLLVVALTAAYSLLVRVAQLGLTVGRYWGSSPRPWPASTRWPTHPRAAPRPWMSLLGGRIRDRRAARALLLLSLTPLLSPYWLSAASQYRLVTRNESRERREDALRYLRFDTGHYGLRARASPRARIRRPPPPRPGESRQPCCGRAGAGNGSADSPWISTNGWRACASSRAAARCPRGCSAHCGRTPTSHATPARPCCP
ncbi:MAG: hypothetical protein U1F11_07905 [Steroidobacteraceae bacterium]